LRKGAATIACGIGTPIEKIMLFGGWARELDAVLDYIDSIILQSPGPLQLFGWVTHGGVPPIVTRYSATDGMIELQHNLNNGNFLQEKAVEATKQEKERKEEKT
jgi:hypothetical protein